jgi:hypothetical protein
MDDGSARDRGGDEQALDDGIIGRLVHRYCDAVCVGDVDAWVETWAEDAVWEIGRGPVRGRPAIRSAFERAMGLFESVNQITFNGSAELDHRAGTGAGRWYMGEFGRAGSGMNLFYLGFYDDTYVRDEEGRWRFASRTLTWLYQGPPDLSGGFGAPTGYYAS